MIGSVDPIAHSCITGFEEVGTAYLDYKQKNISSMTKAINVLFGFGTIFTDFRQIALYFLDTPYLSSATTSMEVGWYLGDMVNIMINSPAPAMKPVVIDEPVTEEVAGDI